MYSKKIADMALDSQASHAGSCAECTGFEESTRQSSRSLEKRPQRAAQHPDKRSMAHLLRMVTDGAHDVEIVDYD